LLEKYTLTTRLKKEYQQLLAFNGRYAVERLDRAATKYQQAFKNDVAAMINERSAMLQGLEQARARKLLMQHRRSWSNEQALADLVRYRSDE
jgi:hypothetical protein